MANQYDDDHVFDYMDDAHGAPTCDICGLPTDGYGKVCTCDDCGLQPDGTCLLAGTEHCDWDCTARNT